MRLKKGGLVNALPGYAPLKMLISDNVELDKLAPLVMLNEEELNMELQLSMAIPHATRHEHELLLFSTVNGKTQPCRIRVEFYQRCDEDALQDSYMCIGVRRAFECSLCTCCFVLSS